MSGTWGCTLILAALTGCGWSLTDEPDPEPQLVVAPMVPESLCATRGIEQAEALPGQLAIDEPTVRAVALGSGGDAAELQFTYRGPSSDVRLLHSGQLRRQVGLKLRAEDGCNLIYVMWRLEPEPGIDVSLKRQRGSHTHAECGTAGYHTIHPQRRRRPPTLEVGSSHSIRAEILGSELTVWIDGRMRWLGELPPSALELVGPAGLRSDNVSLAAELSVAPAGGVSGCSRHPRLHRRHGRWRRARDLGRADRAPAPRRTLSELAAKPAIIQRPSIHRNADGAFGGDLVKQ